MFVLFIQYVSIVISINLLCEIITAYWEELKQTSAIFMDLEKATNYNSTKGKLA